MACFTCCQGVLVAASGGIPVQSSISPSGKPSRSSTRPGHLTFLAGAICISGHISRGHRIRKHKGRGCIRSCRFAVRSVYEFFSGVGGMRLAFKEAVPAREPLPTWRSYEVDEACCAAYCELYGSKYVSGVKRGELWKSRREPDELWRCSIDRLPDAAFE
ncbi:unnamed protein product, partial [Symbiodinium pilosum]